MLDSVERAGNRSVAGVDDAGEVKQHATDHFENVVGILTSVKSPFASDRRADEAANGVRGDQKVR